MHHYVKTPQCAKHQMHTPKNRYDSSNNIEAKGNSNTQYANLYQKEEEIRKTKRDRNQTRKRFKRVEIESTVRTRLRTKELQQRRKKYYTINNSR